MAGGSRPKRALSARATWPAGTIGPAVAADGAGAVTGARDRSSSNGGGNAPLLGAVGPATGGAGGGGWPIGAGGRGGSKTEGAAGVCADACGTTAIASANATAASRRRARPAPCPVALMDRVYR